MGNSIDEKSAVAQDESNSQEHHHGSSKADRIRAIDERATAPGVTRQTWAHINEKKLLRKMDWHLLPILTLLYLLSFIDRGNIVRKGLALIRLTIANNSSREMPKLKDWPTTST